jgi:hypothetical protein
MIEDREMHVMSAEGYATSDFRLYKSLRNYEDYKFQNNKIYRT